MNSSYPELEWIAQARKYIGLKEIKGSRHNPIILSWLKKLKAWWNEDESAWCSTYVGYCLQEANVPIPKHWYRALDYLSYGTRLVKPAYGCVAVKARQGGGHVCFVVGKTMDGKLVCLGGNQNDMVCFALYNEADFEAFIWYGLTNSPAQHRYTLPVLTDVSPTQVTEA